MKKFFKVKEIPNPDDWIPNPDDWNSLKNGYSLSFVFNLSNEKIIYLDEGEALFLYKKLRKIFEK